VLLPRYERRRPGGWQTGAAPEALKEEIRRVFDLIAQQPAIGARATNIRLPGIRRTHLSPVTIISTIGFGRPASKLWHCGIQPL
jgi:hypothetical protein